MIAKKITAIILFIVNLFSISGLGKAFPYLSVLPDLTKVGINYISLNTDDYSVNKTELKKQIEVANKNVSHPFVLVTQGNFDRVIEEQNNKTATDYTNLLYDYSLKNAEALLSLDTFKPMEYKLDEEDSILPISREVINRLVILANAWKVTGETKYAERAWQELEKICGYKDWCNSHFLATAEMALAVSIGYDWLYDYLTDFQKNLLAEKVYDYAVKPALSKNYIKNWFTWSKNNWNSICYSGIGIALMTFSSYYPEEAVEFLSMCYKNMPIAFENFTPDGVYIEGARYGESGMNAIVNFIATSFNFFGTDFGMSEIDGFKQLGSFSAYITTPTGIFNFGDNENKSVFSPCLHWYADKYNSQLISAYQMSDKPSEYEPNYENTTERNGDGKNCVLSNLWYNRSFEGNSEAFENEEKCLYLKSDCSQDLVLMRSAYLDENASFAGIKGGYNYTNHGDLDIGTFIYEALGERWAEELGQGRYDAPDYFVNLPAGGRWKNYCKRAEGQNTLVVNPKLSVDDQYPLATGHFTDFSKNTDGGQCTLDMSEAYCMNGVIKATRKFALSNSYSKLTISDKVICAVPSEIYWFMHTKAEIQISQDGKFAILTKNGKQVKATLSGDGTFCIKEAVALDGKYEYDEDYSDIRKLTVHLEKVYKADISVTLEPYFTD